MVIVLDNGTPPNPSSVYSGTLRMLFIKVAGPLLPVVVRVMAPWSEPTLHWMKSNVREISQSKLLSVLQPICFEGVPMVFYCKIKEKL
jgi:hypothetical protein